MFSPAFMRWYRCLIESWASSSHLLSTFYFYILDTFIYIFCVWMFCMHVCLCLAYVPNMHRRGRPEEGIGLPGGVTLCVCAGNWTHVFWQNCKYCKSDIHSTFSYKSLHWQLPSFRWAFYGSLETLQQIKLLVTKPKVYPQDLTIPTSCFLTSICVHAMAHICPAPINKGNKKEVSFTICESSTSLWVQT